MDAIAADDREYVNRTLANTIQTREPFDIEHRALRRDGTTRLVRSRGQWLAEQGGRPARVVGTSHDITDYRLAHQKLRQSEEQFRSLVTNIPDVTWTATADGRTHYISPNVETVFGFTPTEICEKCPELWFGRIDTGDGMRIAEALQQLFAAGQPFDVEYRVQRKDGEWIWAHNRAYRTYEKDGISYADGIFSDITARKRAEKKLSRSEAYLQGVAETDPYRQLGLEDGPTRIRLLVGRTLSNFWHGAGEWNDGVRSINGAASPRRSPCLPSPGQRIDGGKEKL
jgi:PAS domain S-box-containing protein